MKKIVLIVIIIIVTFACACSIKISAKNFDLPQITWGMSMDEVFYAYGITKEDTSRYINQGRGSMFTLNDYELFGETTSQIDFHFLDIGDNGNLVLCYVTAEYPETADMDKVLHNMQKIYGDTVSNVSIYDKYSAFTGENLHETKYEESEHLKIWANCSLSAVIPENESEDYKNLWIEQKLQPGLSEENWEEFCENSKLVTVRWYDEAWIRLDFDAYNLAVYNTLKDQLSEKELN